MKKRGEFGLILVFILIGFILILSLTSMGFGKDSGVKVDSQVMQELQDKGKVKVIVVMKNVEELPDKLKGVSMQALREQAINNIAGERVKHRFTSFNGFSASLTSDDLKKLEADERIERIDYDAPVHAFLQESVPLVNATRTWPVQVNGINITGEGETICIIDTGVNYTHPDLGGCTIKNTTLNGNTVDNVTESVHPYANSSVYEWNITMPGFSSIAVHFVKVDTESGFDFVHILDSNNVNLTNYSGEHYDFWSPSVGGDTIKIRLTSDSSLNYYGFYIDKVINGTTNSSYNWTTCSKVINGWNTIGSEEPDPYDNHGHGTHVTGIAAASGGIKGVAPDSKIISIKALKSDGTGFTSDVLKGIEWCTNNASTFNISVISMSLGGELYKGYCDIQESSFTAAINSAITKNVSVIVATGNEGNKTAISTPACIQNATAVGWSTDDTDTIHSNSNRNNVTDLLAPGSVINSTRWSTSSCASGCTCYGNYMVCSGTSMATPHVAGAFALVRQFYLLKFGRVLKPAEIQDVLNDTGKLIDDSAGSGLNFSRIDIYSAILQLNGGPNITLNSPNASYTNETVAVKNITFNCSASDTLGLLNISLWITNSNNQSFSLNQTTSISGTSNSTIFVLGLGVGTYTWNCQARNAGGQAGFASSNRSIVLNQAKQIIFIGVDGLQYNHYIEMLRSGELGNFSKLVNNGGWNGTANITGHNQTITAPGNAELHTGLNETLTNITDNTAGKSIPNSNTTFERLRAYNSRIATGSVYGKNTSYIPDGILANAKSEVDWWQNRTTFSNSNWQDGTDCIYSENVSEKAREFIGNYSDQSFYLVVYFGVPDCSGHAHGENSSEYNQSLINVDNGLGIVLDALEDNGLRGTRNVTQIIISADHGWNENSTEHNVTNSDTIVIPLIASNSTLTMNTTSDGLREQCEIAPTILNYFGMSASQYQDIVNNGCDSMLGTGDSTLPSITINSPANGTWYNASRFNISINENGSCWAVFNDVTNITLNNITSARTSFFHENTSVSETTTLRYNVTFYCNDTSGNLNSTARRYFGVDKTAPIVSYVSPAHNYNTTDTTPTFTYRVNDSNDISSCSLLIDNVVKDTALNVLNNTDQTLTPESALSVADHEWQVSCIDEAGNTGITPSHRDITITSSDGEDGDGGDGGSTTTGADEEYTGVTYTLAESVIKNGTDKKLMEEDKVIFRINNRSHTLTIVDVKNKSIRIKIESDIIRADLNISDEKKFDLNKDNYLDFYVKLNGITGLVANITMKEIYELSNISINATQGNESITGTGGSEGGESRISKAFAWAKSKIISVFSSWTWKTHLYVWVPTGVVIVGGITTAILIRRHYKKKKYYEKGVE
jgi:subtilisin family serine protease